MTRKQNKPKEEASDPVTPAGTAEAAPAGQPLSQPATAPISAESADTSRALRFDWQDWLPWLEDDSIPEDQKRRLIETLWTIVAAFVDLGWSVESRPEHAPADAADSCGHRIDLKAALEQAVLRSEITATAEETRHE